MDPCACPFILNYDVFYIQIFPFVHLLLTIFIVVIFVDEGVGVCSQGFLESNQGSGGFSQKNAHI